MEGGKERGRQGMERWKKGGREEGDREEMMDGWMDG